MAGETDAADSLGETGSPDADRHLAENFGMTVKQVQEFDPQTLDVTRACKFLGLALKRFDLLATQPEARAGWVQSVARQQKDLIETFPETGKDMKEMLEAIRKFALRKCLKPDGPAQVDGHETARDKARSRSSKSSTKGLLIGGGALAAILLVGGGLFVLMPTKDKPQVERDREAKPLAQKPIGKADPDRPPTPTPVLSATKDAGAKPPVEQPGAKADPAPTPPLRGVPDRAAATYVFSVGGKVGLNARASPPTLDQLPKEPFRLMYANMRNCGRVTDEGLKAFRGCQHLQNIDLVNTPATGAALANFKDCKDLRVLDLVGSKVDDDGLAQMSDCTKLMFVWLGGTKVTDQGLAPFQKLRQLTHMDVSRTAVTDKGIAGFADVTSLKYFSMARTAVGDSGLAALKNCLYLESLSLDDTKVTDESIPTLGSFTKLKSLSVRGTRITPAGVRKLAAMLPNCKIE